MEMISAISNSRISLVRKLISSRSFRYECGKFVAEGVNIINDIPDGYIEELFMTNDAYEKYMDIIAKSNNINIVTAKVMEAMSDTKSPSGVLAVCNIPNITDRIGDKVVLLDNLNDPGNMGTIIRTCVACGVVTLLLYGSCVDIYSPKVVRASMGGVFHIRPIIVDDLSNLGKDIYVLDMNGENIYSLNNMPQNFILAVGSESQGVSEEVRTVASRTISLPMSSKMESLNAGVSLSIALYHIINGGK